MPPTQALHDAQRAVAGYRSRGRRPAAVFLGAGASRTFGYLLTSELLPQIVRALGETDFLRALTRYDAFFDPGALTYCTGGLSRFLQQWHAA